MKTHGLARRGKQHQLYKTWLEMRYRCESTRKHNYKFYGGRGIKVCDRWKSFVNFITDMGPRPEGMTLDRIDNNGNYEPVNCRWATDTEQMNNRPSFNRIITVDGQKLTLGQASSKWGVPLATLWRRLKLGWNEFDAAKRPVRAHKKYERSQLSWAKTQESIR